MTLVEYSYLGLETIVRANYTGEPGVELTYLTQGEEGNGEAGDRYAGLDRFGRVADQRWLKTSTSTALERIQYGFDRAGNRTFRDNRVAASGQDEFYTYDGLYQVKTLQRGGLNANRTGISGTPAWEEDFNYDSTGNWHGSTTAYRTKTDGNTDLDHNRTHNKANELTGITTTTGPAWVAPVHDRAGNMTTIPQPNAPTDSYACTYDAWNRLVKVMDGQNTLAIYQYDGQNRRTKKTTAENTRHFYYSEKWQVLEERVDDAATAERQFVWGQRHLDDLVLRDLGTERLYVLQDAFHVTGITDTNGAVQQRYGYDALGNPRVVNADWTTSPTPADYEWETLFGGYRWDSDTGLYHVRQRQHHSSLGRWLTRDPLREAGGLALQVYAANNPLNRSDPSGLWAVSRENPAPHSALLCMAAAGSPEKRKCPECGGDPLPATHCCCNGKHVEKKPIATGVVRWRWRGEKPVPGKGWPYHVWLAWDGGSIDANADDLGRISSPAMGELDPKYQKPTPRFTAIELSPCEYDFELLKCCLSAKGWELNLKPDPRLCDKFADDVIAECKEQAKGCTAPPNEKAS